MKELPYCTIQRTLHCHAYGGTPQTMQSLTTYNDIIKEMLFLFSSIIAKPCSLGINDLIIDPGFDVKNTRPKL
jgi:dihydropteroate synthase